MSGKNNSQKVWASLTWLIIASLVLNGCGSKKVYHVGILSGSAAFVAIADGFKTKMTELGYIEGDNIIYDFQKTDNDREGEKRVMKQFVDEGVDLIFTFPTDPALAAKAATEGTDIPVVFAHAALEGANLVDSVRNPGGNMSGTRFPGPSLVTKRFEFLLRIDPGIQRLYIPYDKNYPACAPAIEALRPAAASAGVELVELPITTLDEVRADLQARAATDDISIDAILLMPELLMQSLDGWALISTFAAEQNIPLVGSSDKTVTTGGLFSYNVNPVESGMLAAVIADKILHGTQAGTIPVSTPDAYLRINYKVAQQLDLTVPESILKQADEIIR
jgi:putative ABC transport system substrate-binding protein